MEIDETEIPHAQEVGAGDQQINSYDDNYDVSDDYFPKDNKISLKKQQDRYYTLGADFEWLRDNEINITDEFEESSIAINIGDEILLSESNIVTITGKAKSCKTYINSAITAAAVSKEEQLNFTAEEIVQRVLYIDTEQSKPHVHKLLRRIYQMGDLDMEKNDSRLVMIALRELSVEDRIQAMLTAISTYMPNVVILDGVRDLVRDFNSIEESSDMVNLLMQLTTQYNCGIVCVIHQNKGDGNARGHLGAELMNKSETVMQVVNEKGVITVSPVHCRNKEFEEYSFRINNEGLPELCEASKVTVKVEALSKLMTKAMWGSSWVKRVDLVPKLMELTGLKERTCRTRITEAIDNDILRLNEQGYLVLVTEEERQVPLPF